jgi:aspartate-semialdehyde dehydrogenase
MRVGIVGATGLVGLEMIKVLEERNFPISELFLFASERSLGERLSFRERDLPVEVLGPASFETKNLDFVLFATSAGLSAEYADRAAESGAIVIDNSSHFRLFEDVPLIVPEVNPQAIHQSRGRGVIANPNCSTIQMMVVLKPLQDLSPLQRVIVSTYQSVSGAGSDAMEELHQQVLASFNHQPIEPKAFPYQIAFNCIPQIDVFLENGMTKEEMKMVSESRKILGLPDLKISATAVRVSTFISHSESLNVDLKEPQPLEKIREVLSKSPGLVVLDDPKSKVYPTPFSAAGTDSVYVGRIRRDLSSENGIHLWVVADNLRKGAATNAIQIAELCIKNQYRRR